MPKTTVFFDFDGTLVDHTIGGKVSRMLEKEMAEQTGLPWRVFRQKTRDESNYRRETIPNHPATMDWDDIFNTVAARHNCQLSDTFLGLWRRFLVEMPERVVIFDDAPNVLQQLKNERRWIVLATKGLSKYQLPILEMTGLKPCFDDILTPDITGFLKTEPGFFKAYPKREGEVFIQVGDHYYDDVTCGKRNGFTVILRSAIPELAALSPFERPQHLQNYGDRIRRYPDTRVTVKPDAVVVTLHELPQVIKSIEEQ